jgi:hypothetical protein
MSKMLVLSYPINQLEMTIEFDEDKYCKDNDCALRGKQVTITATTIVVTYEIASNKFQVSVA